ncbi:hypothetical protein [Hymenobacter amundsenii]|uniref:hypothetical protein n=1 Tax=Hymenobacter amundsenii TaxID=2006685 RepID=UPI000F83403B|nr:hypothetical protein [Hymenobacter amundsenii]
MKDVVKYFVSPLLLFFLLIYALSFTPGGVQASAESDFHNVVGIDVDIDTSVFSGPIKLDYNDYKWVYIFPEGDTADVYIHVSPLPLAFNIIRYNSSDDRRDFDDLPGRERYKESRQKSKSEEQSQVSIHEPQQ